MRKVVFVLKQFSTPKYKQVVVVVTSKFDDGF